MKFVLCSKCRKRGLASGKPDIYGDYICKDCDIKFKLLKGVSL